MPSATKPRVTKRTKKIEEVVASDDTSVEEMKPTVTAQAKLERSAPTHVEDVTVDTTATESEAVVAEDSSSDSDSSASVALPMPSKSSSKRSSRRSSKEEPVKDEESAKEEEPVYISEVPVELKERLEYIQHLIDTEDEEMLERMYRFLQSSPYYMEEQLNIIRSGLAELNRRAILTAQYEWAEERAAAIAEAQAAAEAAERAAMEAEEKRLREYELAELAKLQAKYKKPLSKCELASRILMGAGFAVSIALSFLK
jgi:hypothetical protein